MNNTIQIPVGLSGYLKTLHVMIMECLLYNIPIEENPRWTELDPNSITEDDIGYLKKAFQEKAKPIIARIVAKKMNGAVT